MAFILSASAAIVSVAMLLLFNLHREQLIRVTQASVESLSQLVEINIHHAMLTGDRELVTESIQSIMSSREFDTLMLLDSQGVVQASSIETEVGHRFKQTDDPCQACHTGDNLPTKTNLVLTEQGGRRVMLTFNSIRNRAECTSCHDPGEKTLGMMIVQTSLEGVNKQLTTNAWQMLGLTLTCLVVFMILVTPFINRRIICPLEQLSRGLAEISVGKFDAPIKLQNPGDLGDLVQSFDTMRQQLQIGRIEMERREQELAIMNEVGLVATQLLELPKILDYAVDTMTSRLGMADARIFLWDEDEGRYTMRAARGISQEQVAEIERRRRSGWDITHEVIESGKPVFVPNMALDARFQGVWDNLEDRSYLNMPLLSRGYVAGSISMVTPPGRILADRDVDFMLAVGREIGIAIDNAILFANAQKGEQQAIALYELGTKISATLVLDNALAAIVQAARQLVEADISMVGLVDDFYDKVTIMAASGDQAEKLIGLVITSRGQVYWDALLDGHYIIHEPQSAKQANPILSDLIEKLGISSTLLVPLQSGSQFLGIIGVMVRQDRQFRSHHVQVIQRLAQKVTLAIQNALLYRQLRYLAALEERDRLAREMHDHLSQGLGYIKIRTAITDDLLSDGKIDQARESLSELKRATQTLYTDVREEIFNLRTAITEHLGFFTILQDYLADYKTHYGLDVHLAVEDDSMSVISPEVSSQLLRIIQEALTNVRRHSGAGSASISCTNKDGRVSIIIEDLGRGFIPEQVNSTGGEHIGLQIMRERVESIGGSLTLDTNPGQGTRVIVHAPIERPS